MQTLGGISHLKNAKFERYFVLQDQIAAENPRFHLQMLKQQNIFKCRIMSNVFQKLFILPHSGMISQVFFDH
jgi:hypothetical protein